ncbi:hypothetical protein M513_05371 [Trichuris suis]|uniref:Uncharacterized protein n=2 Tax=Trichuris suis TaxID=68888 RepID=A0A085M8X0_9BILA|nr:hypothetical protein M513_05371 [Trichuris suis]
MLLSDSVLCAKFPHSDPKDVLMVVLVKAVAARMKCMFIVRLHEAAADVQDNCTCVLQSAVRVHLLPPCHLRMMTDIKADESSEESEDENSTVRSLSCKMQRKVFSVLAKKKWARHFLSDALVQFLDQLYSLLKVQYSAKDSKKIVNNIIRLFGKVYLLSRGEQLSPDETRALNDVERQLRNFLLTMISFHDLDYTYDPTFLSDKLDCICTGLTKVVDHHLTEKSKARILMVGRSLRNKEFLDSMYKPDSRVPDVDSFFLCAKQLIDKWET